MSVTSKLEENWAQPKAVTDLDVALGAGALALMPARDEIPQEFHHQTCPWVKFQSDWFSRGLRRSSITPKDGVDMTAALRHLSAIQGSWEPKHEHKMAGVAFLASLWFDDYTPSVSA